MDAELMPWVELLETLSTDARNLTVGLISGSRELNPRTVLDRMAMAGLSDRVRRGLLVRLNLGDETLPKRQLRSARASDQPPTPIVSPIGNWFEVSIPMKLGASAPHALERLPRWLSAWKREFARVLLDLGPLDQPICRSVGRYCDANLLVLGPETCASPTWLRRHIDHLTQCKAILSGSIVVSTESRSAA